MSTKSENVKVGVNVAHSTGSSEALDQSNHQSLLGLDVSMLPVIPSKTERLNDLIENLALPATFLLLLTIPILLLCAGSTSLMILRFAYPFIGIGITCGVLLFLHRSKKPLRFPSIIAQGPPYR